MIDLSDLPKQWLLLPDRPEAVAGAQVVPVAGRWLVAAEDVPVTILSDEAGAEVGWLVGWAIDAEGVAKGTRRVALAAGEGPEDVYARIGGRFVMIWLGADGRLRLREDATGGLPATYVPEAGIAGATMAAIDQVAELPVDEAVRAVFDFPTRRGFLPFGLTDRIGAARLMANHDLDLTDMTACRAWPPEDLRPLAETDADAIARLVDEVATILRGRLRAILRQGETKLYLSGGRDSRIVLAAAAAAGAEPLRAQTLTSKGGLDVHVAGKAAALAGVPLEVIRVAPPAPADLTAWLRRTGGSIYDRVADTTTTMARHAPENPPLTGTGAELLRGNKLSPGDAGAPVPSVAELLTRLRLPAVPPFETAARRWLDGLPAGADAARAMDLASIEMILGCWAGAAIYGNPIRTPSLLPVGDRRLSEIALTLPPDYRRGGGFYRDVMDALHPGLGAIPFNKAVGLNRLRYWKQELRELTPTWVKRAIKPFR